MGDRAHRLAEDLDRDQRAAEEAESDKAVALGKAALASRYDLAKTKDPRIGLSFNVLDGSGPYWAYTLFYESIADYVAAQIDALTGKVNPPG